ncbi:immune inhibitor A domain-containing protein [Paractinoplanes atraurantiacus]|uniref:Immune inhibitor A peptidase M6 n=1 Tax=Paractinoplanes atraurantiacus TaxID=1036182 RepID=A0A285IM65_9ACTN|nr:immune inhibitor A domain-containing protein [Actinoplanes atraurantiacus]SNY49095.1 Immune inhibitor A peptidase M6 [Actinoplanes atraurantiacus]
MDRVRFAAFAVIALLIPLAAAPGPALADRDHARAAADARELSRTRFTLGGRALPENPRYRPRAKPEVRSRAAVQPKPTPPVGTVREWVGLDDTTGKFYNKKYTLRAVGRHIEVWVAQDLAFPAADCRKGSVEITDAQVADLIGEFDRKIYPLETAIFSTPPSRDGTKATATGDFTGDGDKTVTLVDNVRDANFFTFPKAVTYTAGFFTPQLNELFDRNVMTIDAYDWKHRLGAEPADDPTTDLCTSRPARPRMYESTFAHEWQHLLEYYADPQEAKWLNEGLADFAQTLVGYVDARSKVDEPGNDTHIMCFQGFGTVKTKYNANPRDCGGPQNSPNLWDEGTPSEVLADYGLVYELMLYLRDRFGLRTISVLHRDGIRQGMAAIQAALPTGVPLYEVMHDFQTMTLVDRIAGEPGGKVIGMAAEKVTAKSLRSTVNLDNKTAYAEPGAAPNGADYVPLPTPVRSLSFAGAAHLPPLPTGWTVAGKTLFSGNTNDLDSHAVRAVTIPAGKPALTLETSYALEDRYDYGYVTVSTDGGRTYMALRGDRTSVGPLGFGITGASNGVVTARYDLTSYAGKKVLLGLRFVTDAGGGRGGWRIGTITLGGRTLSDGSTLDGWTSPTSIRPMAVHNWHVRLVGLGQDRVEIVAPDEFARLSSYPQVVAIVSYDEPTEKIKQYAPYRLTVNGVLQPGGSKP